jgi:hypothetical protein
MPDVRDIVNTLYTIGIGSVLGLFVVAMWLRRRAPWTRKSWRLVRTDRELVNKLDDFERHAIRWQADAAEALEIWSLIRDELLNEQPSPDWWFARASDALEPALLDMVEAWRAAPPAVRADLIRTIDGWMQHIAEEWRLIQGETS